MRLQAVSTPLAIAPIRHPKRGTWYYGMHCACRRFLCLCEDLFAGRGDDLRLAAPMLLEVRCQCGRVSNVRRLQRFRTP
jgi:hypothetical protein